MASENKCLMCEFLQADAAGSYHCQFTGESWRKYPNGCQSCVNIPPTEQLLNSNQQDKREQFQKEIRQNLKAGRATLVLGAGISVPMKMPDWLGLVSRMSGHALLYRTYKQPDSSNADREYQLALEKDLSSGKLKLFNGVNVLESGQYIAQILEASAKERAENGLIKGVISDIIEDSIPPETFLREHSGFSPEDIAKDNTLCAVAYLLQADGGFRRALTYNFDTLVQEYLISVFGVPPERVITYSECWNQDLENVSSDPIRLFHVHGCIPRYENQKCPNSAFPKESGRIILSEDSYYDTERYEAYNWQNSIQSFCLNRDSCVFVGFSADDYNFRRILRQMGDHRSRESALPKHYLIFAIDQLVRDTWAVVCRHYLSFDVTPEKVRRDALILLSLQLEMKANYWKRYGFHPIWITIQDIPEFLLSLL